MHDAAEAHPFQKAFFSGALPKDEYGQYLGQLLLVHQALESSLESKRSSCDAVNTSVQELQYQVPFLMEDLKFLNVNVDSIKAKPSTEKIIARINEAAEKNPVSLLGFHYVLFGSKNGGRFIAQRVREIYSLSDKGVRYMDPYGDQQRKYWQDFKDQMNACALSEADQLAIVESAKTMFVSFGEILSDLIPQ